MDFISSTIIAFLVTLLFITSLCFIMLRRKRKEDFFDIVIDRVSSLIDSKMEKVTYLYKTGPWYLVVYTKDSNYPIWISHNTIRSIHPDPKNYKIIIKQFNGEGVIENVESYEMCAASDLCDYDM